MELVMVVTRYMLKVTKIDMVKVVRNATLTMYSDGAMYSTDDLFSSTR
jgi:hypothetical protein